MKKILFIALTLVIVPFVVSAGSPRLGQTDTLIAWDEFDLACERGDLATVKYLAARNHLSQLIKTSEFRPKWQNSFALAAQNGHVEVCEFLIVTGAPPGWGLEVAVKNRQTAVVKLLLDKGAFNRYTEAMNVAASNGDLEIIRLLVDKGANIPKRPDYNGEMPLHLAAMNGHLAVVKYFIDKGVPVDLLANSNYSALLYAALGRHRDVCDFLLSRGARTDIFTEAALGREEQVKKILAAMPELLKARLSGGPNNTDAYTPAHFAAAAGRMNILQLLARKGVNLIPEFDEAGTPLHAAAGGGRYETVKYLLNHGAKPDAMERNGFQSPLNLAVEGGHIRTAELLLSRGAKVDNITMNMGKRALQIAVDRGDLNMCRMLIAHGADAKLGNWNNETPLHRVSNGEIARLLIRNGARVNVRGWHNCTPLYYASYQGLSDVVNVLVQYGADVNLSCEGQSPLLIAAEWGHKEIVALLLSRKADINQVNRDQGWGETANTALHLAAYRGQIEVVALLISKGAKINLRNKDGLTPLGMANSRGNLFTADYIRQHGGTE